MTLAQFLKVFNFHMKKKWTETSRKMEAAINWINCACALCMEFEHVESHKIVFEIPLTTHKYRTLSFSFIALFIEFLAQSHSQLSAHWYGVSHIALCQRINRHRHNGILNMGVVMTLRLGCVPCFIPTFSVSFLFFHSFFLEFTLIALSYILHTNQANALEPLVLIVE